MKEIVRLRDRYARHYEVAPGQYAAQISAAPIHFEDQGGDWRPLEEIVATVPGGWVMATKDATWGIQNGSLAITYAGRTLTMKPASIGMVDRTAPATRWRKLADADYSDVSRAGRKITVANIFPQTDLVVEFTDDGITKVFNVRAKPNLPDPTALGWDAAKTYLVIVWDITRPDGAVVKDSDGVTVGNGYVGNKDLLIQTPGGETVFTFGAGAAISTPHNSLRGREGPVWYLVAGANVPFGEAISYARSQITTYPLAIDPNVTFGPPIAEGNSRFGAVYMYPTSAQSHGWLRVGDDGWYDPGNGKDIEPTGGGGNIASFAGYNLTSIPIGATCNSATLTGLVSNTPVSSSVHGGSMTVSKTASDWYPIDTGDLSLGLTAIGTASLPTNLDKYTYGGIGTDGASRLYGAVAGLSTHRWSSTDGMATITISAGTTFIPGSPAEWLPGVGQWYWPTVGSVYGSQGESATDGINTVYSSANVTIGGVSYANGKLFAIGALYSSALLRRAFLVYSTNGANWTQCTTPLTASGGSNGWASTVVWDGSRYLMPYRTCVQGSTTLQGGIAMLTSNDGITWTSLTTTGLPTTGYAQNNEEIPFFYANGKFIISPNGYQIGQSTDGETWTMWRDRNPPLGKNGGRCVYLDGVYYIPKQDGGYYTATDSTLYDPYQWVVATTDVLNGAYWRLAVTGGSKYWFSRYRLYARKETGSEKTYHGIIESAALNTSAVAASFGGWLPLRIAPTTYVAGSFTDGYPGLFIDYSSGASWVSPPDGANIETTTPLVWSSVVSASPAHFQLDMATDSGFTANKVSKRSFLDSGFEYWDGAAWQTLTSAGMPANKTGNNVRYAPTGQSVGTTFYRRVRQG